MDRYVRNIGTLTQDENQTLHDSKVLVAGCGGLGGYIIQMLARLGIGHITAVDPDVFDRTNLNRQLFADELSIGKSKALITKERIKLINPDIDILPVIEYIDTDNGEKILAGHDLVIDALDNIPSRLVIEEICKNLNIPLVHGAIAGWYGQVCSVLPGDDTLSRIYSSDISKGIERHLGNPAFTPALVASIQVSEAVKILIKRGELLQNKLLFMDLLDNEFITLDV